MSNAFIAREPAPRYLTSAVDPDHIWALQGATWADVERLTELRGENPTPRFTFLDGDLEIMSPSRSHEQIKSTLSHLIAGWCLERGIDVSAYGSWQLRSRTSARGIEPDECYVVGDVSDPRVPDLAIEVVWTSGGIDKLKIYRTLGIREVWFWRDWRLEAFALRPEGYEAIEHSEVLPGLDPQFLLRFVSMRPMTRAVRELRAAMQP
ncbi:MAG: Uma2 family endonuclease [Myxococcota bacterium]